MKWQHLWINARLATMQEGRSAYGAIENAAIAVADGRIAYAGPMRDLSDKPATLSQRVTDAKNQWVTPGLIDCHTHLVFAGNRAGEFEQRLNGVSYEDISRAGGGIMSTVRATRAASDQELLTQSRVRLTALKEEGVTTVEIKSGYGLDLETERRMLRTARKLSSDTGMRVSTTFLGLHALPPNANRADFVAQMCGPVLDAIAAENLADAVDAYCETIAFTTEETTRFFNAATAHGLKIKLHADQLSDTNGANLAAQFNALSADHLEYTNEAGVRAMGDAGTAAVLLPGAFYMLRETKLPPVDALRRHKVPIAVASDCNPGTSPIVSLKAAMVMACTSFRLTPEEVLAGVTRNAATALSLSNETGTLEAGKAADFAIWSIEHPAELCYWLGGLKPSYVHSAKSK